MLHSLVVTAFLLLHNQGWPDPRHMPQIIMVDRDAIPYHGTAAYREGVIYLLLGERLDTVRMQGKVLHEAVHHLQREASGDATNCEEWGAREDQALEIHRLYLGQRDGLAATRIWRATCL